ncbi:hypothetical protein [Nostoc sp. ChiQUE01b]|nr:hypothetical protein [Nostoc sp. ChiQUE01b]MDZ8257877.1 hypothetical protein [Nostoc sp. ChiQUE01b]
MLKLCCGRNCDRTLTIKQAIAFSHKAGDVWRQATMDVRSSPRGETI